MDAVDGFGEEQSPGRRGQAHEELVGVPLLLMFRSPLSAAPEGTRHFQPGYLVSEWFVSSASAWSLRTVWSV